MGDIARALELDTSGIYYYYENIPEIINTNPGPSVAINHYMMTYLEANDSILVTLKQARKEKELGALLSPNMILPDHQGDHFRTLGCRTRSLSPRLLSPRILGIFVIFQNSPKIVNTFIRINCG